MATKRVISVIGLGYVGLSLTIALQRKFRVIGFDLKNKRITELKQNYDNNGEISAQELSQAQIEFTSDANNLSQATIHIITVPTLLNVDKKPDLSPLLIASETIGKLLKPGDIVIYESSVYPGATEEKCIPVLESSSKLRCGLEFGVAYSPERLNPGDKQHTFASIAKIVSASDKNTLDQVCDIYSEVISAQIYRAPCIKIAEAAKLMENIQRDLNIALMNEYALIMHAMDLNITEVYKAMQTKWNALKFTAGFVGGHCLSINNYYLTYKAQQLGVNSEFIQNAGKINEAMPSYIAETIVKLLRKNNVVLANAKIAILGFTFKENCPDIKDTEVIKLVDLLAKEKTHILVSDPIADSKLAKEIYNIDLSDFSQLNNLDAVVIAIAHQQYMNIENEISAKLKDKGLIIDIKGIIDTSKINTKQVKLWQI